MAEAIQAWFAALRPTTVLDLHIVPNNFRHRRSLSFDGYAGFEVHNGLDSFNGPTIAEEMTLTVQAGTADKVAAAFAQLVTGAQRR